MLTTTEKITDEHRDRRAYIYVRQSTAQQVHHYRASQLNPYGLVQCAQALGWLPERIHVIDVDQGQSGQDPTRPGFRELISEVSLGRVGLICADEASRLARNNAEWAFVAPYLTLMTEDAPQRDYPLREVFNGLRWLVRAGATWRLIPHDLPPWWVVYQQTQRWIKAGVFEDIVHDLRRLLRLAVGRDPDPTAAIFDGRTLQSTPESGARAGYAGHKHRKGSKTHIAMDTLGHLLALQVTPANEQERAQVAELSKQVQAVTGEHVEIVFVDQGYTGDAAETAAADQGIKRQVVKLPEAKRGFVLLPQRWVVERLRHEVA